MITPVILKVGNRQTDPDGKTEDVKALYRGRMYERDGKCCISYEETGENETGNITKCMLKISGEKIELNKKGDVSYNMVFKKGGKEIFSYGTPYGAVPMTVETLRLDVRGDISLGLVADIRYDLDMSGYVLNCEMTIQAEPVTDVKTE